MFKKDQSNAALLDDDLQDSSNVQLEQTSKADILLSNLSKHLKLFGTHFDARPDDSMDVMVGQQTSLETESEEEIEAEATMDADMFNIEDKEHQALIESDADGSAPAPTTPAKAPAAPAAPPASAKAPAAAPAKAAAAPTPVPAPPAPAAAAKVASPPPAKEAVAKITPAASAAPKTKAAVAPTSDDDLNEDQVAKHEIKSDKEFDSNGFSPATTTELHEENSGSL